MFRLIARDLAVDLGTANTLIFEKGTGVILNEPSVVAIKVENGKKVAVAYGSEAKPMLGRTPEGVRVVRPIRTGVIADFEAAQLMLSHFISRALQGGRGLIRKPRVVVGVPSGITEVEKRAIKEAIEEHAREVKLIDEAMAAAIGCKLPVTEATASMIVDIGGGTTDIAVVSLSDVVYSVSLREGGDAMDEAIINFLRRKHHILVGEATAELVKKAIGSAHKSHSDQEMEVRGRSLITGSPAAIIVRGDEIAEALSDVVNSIVSAIRQALEHTPPELSGDIISRGVFLAGGGSLLKGLSERITEDLNVLVTIAEDPLSSVVEGAGLCLESEELYGNVYR
jgi:rod shape-determining protein MreB and related proteins